VSGPDHARLSVVVVTHNSSEAVARCMPRLVEQLEQGDEVIVVDNASADATLDAVARAAPAAKVLRQEHNLGFAAGCNIGAAAASGELLLLLNPDALPAPGFAAAIRRPYADNRGWAAWMGVVTMDGGERINTSGGIAHFTGIAWSGEAGKPAAEVPDRPMEVAFVSGACLAVPLNIWREHGGFDPEFFMYCEDVDLSFRLRLAGGRLGVEPAARVDHDYTFVKGAQKWRLLERNRWATVLRTYPGGLLVLLAPALALSELGLLPIALRGGWSRSKAAAALDTLRAFPRLVAQRRALQADRRIDTLEFARWLTPDLSSMYLGAVGRHGLLRWALRAYWRVVLALLAATRRAR
jgi:GT2 family glycosyltransferase